MRKLWRVLRWVLLGVVLVVLGLAAFVAWNVRDRHPGYELSFFLPQDPSAPASELQVGFGRAIITPSGYDWVIDRNGNARYEPAEGDSFVDNDGDGDFDPIYLAGFHNNRPAAGVHDDIVADVVVLDDGRVRVALVSLDAIGFMHNDVIEVRRALPKELGIDHLIVHSVHNHEVPDLIGIWGPDPFHSGVDPAYRDFVMEQVLAALRSAVRSMRPARLERAQVDVPKELVVDSRDPQVIDLPMRVLVVRDAETDDELGTLVFWANHPETLGSGNLLITADYVGYLRNALERGVEWEGRPVTDGLGGQAVFFNGAIGGLMTPLDAEIEHPFTHAKLKEDSFEKAEALGTRLAFLALEGARNAVPVEAPVISLAARTFRVQVANLYFQLGSALGVLDRGWTGWKKLRTEIDVLEIGDVTVLTIPGEIYPEIVVGGIEHPEGADYDVEPVEVPPLYSLLRGEMKILIGLANDEIGYIIPLSEWDVKEPYLYGAEKSPYGEVNSVGPKAGPTVYKAARGLIEDFYAWKELAPGS